MSIYRQEIHWHEDAAVSRRYLYQHVITKGIFAEDDRQIVWLALRKNLHNENFEVVAKCILQIYQKHI